MTELNDDGTQWGGVMCREGRREVLGTRMDNQSQNVYVAVGVLTKDKGPVLALCG